MPGKTIQALLGGVLGANILAMSLLNFVEAPGCYLPFVYLVSMVSVGGLLIWRAPPMPRLTKQEHGLCIAFAIVIFLPRLPLLLETLLGYSVNVVGDDAQHLQIMSSIAHAESFPPRSAFDSNKYLGYYYAPWILGAALYKSGLLSTVKQALALTVLMYSFFSSYSVMYASRILFQSRRLQNIFLTLCAMYGGFDFIYWVSTLSLAPIHSEWWASELGVDLEFSNLITLLLWVQQHTLAAVATLYSMFLFEKGSNRVTSALSGLFLLSAFFSSVYVVVGAGLIVAWWFFQRRSPWWSSAIAASTFLTFSVPLWWIYLGKLGESKVKLFLKLDPFWSDRLRAAFLVFLLVVTLELLPLIAAAYLSSIRERPSDSKYVLFILCILFILSTFFIEFGQGGNYPLRGSIIPIFALTYLATPVVSEWFKEARGIAPRVLFTAYLLGGVLEYAAFSRYSLIALEHSNTKPNAAILLFNEGKSSLTAEILLRLFDQGDSYCAPALPGAICWDRDMLWYLIEREFPRKKQLFDDDIFTMVSDSRYRVTASSIEGLYNRWNGHQNPVGQHTALQN